MIHEKTVVYRAPGMDAVAVRRDVEYRATDTGVLTMDVYAAPGATQGARSPAVVLVAGFPDEGFRKVVGCGFKEMGSSVSWGRLMAASGITAIAYTNREPVADLDALLEHLRRNAEDLGVDETRIGLWACSGNVPLALSALMGVGRETVKCAALCYGYMLALDGSTVVAEAAGRFGFANPNAGTSVDDLPADTPLFVVRAGQDEMPRLNETIDRFVADALARNLPIALVNHASAPHAFDLLDDGETSREVVRRILAFLRFHLLA